MNYDHGYHQVYTLTIKNGKISDLKYDQVNKKGQSKTQNASYEKQMKKYSKVGSKEYIKKLRKEFLDNDGDMEKVQVVSGATESSNDFITYVSQLLNAAQKGSMKATLFYWRFKIEKKITCCILAFSNASFCSYGMQHEE